MVVGWYRDVRLYRLRQHLKDRNPSAQHHKDKITAFRVRTRAENAFLLPPEQRTPRSHRGKGWSGRTSWWYAEETTDREARTFVREVMAFIDGQPVLSVRAFDNGLGLAWPVGADEFAMRWTGRNE